MSGWAACSKIKVGITIIQATQFLQYSHFLWAFLNVSNKKLFEKWNELVDLFKKKQK